jgi:iron complex transport system permease protein
MKKIIIVAASILFLVLLCAFSLSQGKYPLSLETVWNFVSGSDVSDTARAVLLNIRLPRILGAVLIGAALAASGASYQSMFVNPLVSPGILGVLSGAGFGASLGMVLGNSWYMVQILAFGFGLAAAALAIGLSRFYRADRILTLILGGIISSSMFTALLSVVKYIADPNDELPAITYWLMGGLSMISLKSLLAAAPLILGGLAVMILFARRLNVLSMGDDEARSLGVLPRRARLIFICASTLACVASVCIGGVIGWIGLLTPHIGRLVVGPDNKFLIPFSALTGAALLLMADNLSRLYLPVELPAGITTSLLGIPFFAYCMKGARTGGPR